jgi:hypothetical protein
MYNDLNKRVCIEKKEIYKKKPKNMKKSRKNLKKAGKTAEKCRKMPKKAEKCRKKPEKAGKFRWPESCVCVGGLEKTFQNRNLKLFPIYEKINQKLFFNFICIVYPIKNHSYNTLL